MTWVRLDDSTPLHPKLLDAGAEAAWLWVASIAHANRHTTNGLVSKRHVAALYPPLANRAPKLTKKLLELGMWLEHDADHYRIHDYEHYQEEALRENVEARREADRARKRRERERKRRQKAGQSEGSHGVTGCDVPQGRSADVPRGGSGGSASGVSQAPGPSRPVPARPEGGDPPSPPFPRKRDPMALSREREDVQRVFAKWKTTFGFERASLGKAGRSADADILADAIDEQGEQACLAVLDVAPEDGMVSGKQDDKGKPHQTIRYIFGNTDTLHRLLRAVDERAGRSARQRSAKDLYREYTSR